MYNGRKQHTPASKSATLDALSAQDRLRPERARRGRVEKVWRSVRWAEAYPDESLTMNAVDLTPTFALRKLAVLFDGGKVAECAALVRRLTAITLESILSQLPVDILHEALPSSLPVLEAIYVKVAQTQNGRIPTETLRTDQLVQRLVALFAKHPFNQSGATPGSQGGSGSGDEKNCNLHVPCCRSILRVIMNTEPNFRRLVAQRKKALDRCLRKMGQHGLVTGADRQLVSLHEALRAEMDRQVAQYKGALQKQDQLSLASGKHGHGGAEKLVTGKSAPTEASHQRLLQLTRGEVQERVIKNKTLLTCLEPAVHNMTLYRLLRILRSRVEADKLLLFHDTELRKMAANTSRARLTAMAQSSSPSSPEGGGSPQAQPQNQQLATALRQFSQGYAALLRLTREVAEAQGEMSTILEEEEDAGSEGSSEDEEQHWIPGTGFNGVDGDGDYLSVTSTLSILRKMKVVTLNGILPAHTGRLGVNSARLRRNGWLDVPQQTTSKSTGQRSRDQNPLWLREAGGRDTAPRRMDQQHNGGDPSNDAAEGENGSARVVPSRIGVPMPGMVTEPPGVSSEAVAVASNGHGVAMLEQEVLYLRQELTTARDQIRKLQEQEKQLRERLMGQAHQNFQMGNDQFEDVSLGQQRPTELIRRYGDLYLDSRVEALDALDRLSPLRNLDVLKLKILFSVVVLSFKAAQQNVGELRGRLRHLLNLPLKSTDQYQHHLHHSQQLPSHLSGDTAAVSEGHSPAAASAQMELHITSYLCKTAGSFEVAELVFEVCQQIYATLFDYPCLKACAGLLEYVSQCVRVAWGLCVQRSTYTISYEAQTFDAALHARFHTSDPDGADIKSYLWPALVDSHGACVSKAVVIT